MKDNENIKQPIELVFVSKYFFFFFGGCGRELLNLNVSDECTPKAKKETKSETREKRWTTDIREREIWGGGGGAGADSQRQKDRLAGRERDRQT